jgi:hypothetical protein
MEFLIIFLVIYFLPTIIGMVNKKKNAVAIFTLNFFAGWTIVGWVIALTWATMKD